MAGQDPTWGVILDPKKPVPIFHFPGSVEDDEYEETTIFTRCGRAVTWSGLVPWLPLRHLKRFARPCRSCSSA